MPCSSEACKFPFSVMGQKQDIAHIDVFMAALLQILFCFQGCDKSIMTAGIQVGLEVGSFRNKSSQRLPNTSICQHQ